MKTTLLLSITFGLISALPLPINGVDDAIRAAANNGDDAVRAFSFRFDEGTTAAANNGDDAIRAVDQNGQFAAQHPAGQVDNGYILFPEHHGQALPPWIPQSVFGNYPLGFKGNRINFRAESYLVGSGPDAISREEIIRLFREATAAASQRGHTVTPVETIVGDNLLRVQFKYWRPWTPQEIAAGKRLFE